MRSTRTRTSRNSSSRKPGPSSKGGPKRGPKRPQSGEFKGKSTSPKRGGKFSKSAPKKGGYTKGGKWAKSEREERNERPAQKPRKSRGKWKTTAYKLTAPTTSVSVERRAPRAEGEAGLERLQKVIARAGVASRRNAELLILEGSVTVNGQVVTELGTKVDPKRDKIKVSGKLLHPEAVEPVYIVLYKPKGVISALSDPEGRKHLGDLLTGVKERVVPIGRLNYTTEGCILLTNDGDLADRILKTRGIPRIDMVKIKGHPTEDDIDFLKRGIFTPEGVVRVASYAIEQSLKSKSWLKLEITEGAGLDIRELLIQRGVMADRVVRTAIGHLSIKGMQPGQFKYVKRTDFERLLATRVAAES